MATFETGKLEGGSGSSREGAFGKEDTQQLYERIGQWHHCDCPPSNSIMPPPGSWLLGNATMKGQLNNTFMQVGEEHHASSYQLAATDSPPTPTHPYTQTTRDAGQLSLCTHCELCTTQLAEWNSGLTLESSCKNVVLA